MSLKYKWTTSSVAIGIGLIVVGGDIMIFGELRSLVILGGERYLLGGVFSILGIVILVAPIFGRK